MLSEEEEYTYEYCILKANDNPADLSAIRGESEYKMNNHENFLHMYPNMNLYGYVDTDIIAERKAMLNKIYGTVTKPSTSFCNEPHRISGSIANQLNFWCAYCRWRHNPKTYYKARERINVELSEYAAYNPYC